MSPLVNLSEGTPFAISPFAISKSSLKACPFIIGIVCVSTAMVAVDVSDVEEEPLTIVNSVTKSRRSFK